MALALNLLKALHLGLQLLKCVTWTPKVTKTVHAVSFFQVCEIWPSYIVTFLSKLVLMDPQSNENNPRTWILYFKDPRGTY